MASETVDIIYWIPISISIEAISMDIGSISIDPNHALTGRHQFVRTLVSHGMINKHLILCYAVVRARVLDLWAAQMNPVVRNPQLESEVNVIVVHLEYG